MSESSIQVTPGVGPKVRSIERTIATQDVNQQVMADVFNGGEVLADQVGADGVLTFTFAETKHLVWVRSDGGDARADPFGGTPAADTGIFCEDGIPMPLTIATMVVKVYASAGVTICVHGYHY